jgi:antitoxin (DNA-binding transcriptional repressor) of toxin-antitoxin stability system
MTTLTLPEAKARLPDVIRSLAPGEGVVIVREQSAGRSPDR